MTALAEALSSVLGDTCHLSRVTRCLGWNVVGPGSHEVERCLAAQAAEMDDALDGLAWHLRCLGRPAVPRRSGAGDGPRPGPDGPGTGQTLLTLLTEQEALRLSIEAAMDIAVACDEPSTLQLLLRRLDAHRGHMHRLRQLSGERPGPF